MNTTIEEHLTESITFNAFGLYLITTDIIQINSLLHLIQFILQHSINLDQLYFNYIQPLIYHGNPFLASKLFHLYSQYVSPSFLLSITPQLLKHHKYHLLPPQSIPPTLLHSYSLDPSNEQSLINYYQLQASIALQPDQASTILNRNFKAIQSLYNSLTQPSLAAFLNLIIISLQTYNNQTYLLKFNKLITIISQIQKSISLELFTSILKGFILLKNLNFDVTH